MNTSPPYKSPLFTQSKYELSSRYLPLPKLRICFLMIAFIIGLAHTWFVRNVDFLDGLSYIDMGDAFFQGNHESIINGYWSPLYPLLIGFFLYLFKPTPYWELTIVHFTNFFIYLIALISFDFFLKQIAQVYKQPNTKLIEEKNLRLPEWAIISLGYTLFIWSSMNLITISVISPDMLVSAIVYLASGILLKIKSGVTNWYIFIIFSIVLSLGYLSKTAMLPIALVFFFLSIFATPNIKRVIPQILISFLIFLILVSPYIFSLSNKKGYFTIGESSKLVYEWVVNQHIYCWFMDFSENIKLKHPPKELFHNPKAYEYATPFSVTYSPWYEPSYWCEGTMLHFNIKSQLKVLLTNSKSYCELIFGMQRGLLIAYLILFFASTKKILYLKNLREGWALLIPAIAGISMYWFVFVAFRYIGAFIVLFWLGLFSTLKLPRFKVTQYLINYLIGITVVFMIIESVISRDLITNINYSIDQTEWNISECFKEIGIKKGDKVAIIGMYDSLPWARYTRVHVIAEVPDKYKNAFWTSSEQCKLQLLKTFKNVGAKVVLTGTTPLNTTGWKNIKGTKYYFYPL